MARCLCVWIGLFSLFLHYFIIVKRKERPSLFHSLCFNHTHYTLARPNQSSLTEEEGEEMPFFSRSHPIYPACVEYVNNYRHFSLSSPSFFHRGSILLARLSTIIASLIHDDDDDDEISSLQSLKRRSHLLTRLRRRNERRERETTGPLAAVGKPKSPSQVLPTLATGHVGHCTMRPDKDLCYLHSLSSII